MRVLSFVLLFFLLFGRVEGTHKPISDSVMAYVMKELFKDAGGLEAAQLLLDIVKEENQIYFQTEEDIKLIFKAAGKDYDKAQEAFRGVGSAFKLFNSGLNGKAAVDLIKEAKGAGIDVSNPSLIILHAFRARGENLAEKDTLLILRGLRQGEFLNHHLEKRNNLEALGTELKWYLIFEKVIIRNGVEILEVTQPSKNLGGIRVNE